MLVDPLQNNKQCFNHWKTSQTRNTVGSDQHIDDECHCANRIFIDGSSYIANFSIPRSKLVDDMNYKHFPILL